jgi:hypothetical protein
MVPVAAPVFLRLADGVVLGTPVPAKALTPADRGPSLPSTGGTAATSTTRSVTSTKAVAPAGDAAVADPSHQIDAAVADTTRSGTAR